MNQPKSEVRYWLPRGTTFLPVPLPNHLLPFAIVLSLRVRSRGYLPHWELDDSLYFVTYRLADSLPAHTVEALRHEKRRLMRAIAPNRSLTAVERARIRQQFAIRLDHYLDAGYGSCVLKDPRIADVVAANLNHGNGKTYDLHAWCVMPNHVHVLFHLEKGANLCKVVHGWKSCTAHVAQREFGVKAPLWMREYFDRIIRDQTDYESTRSYIQANPKKAGLEGWRWVWMRED